MPGLQHAAHPALAASPHDTRPSMLAGAHRKKSFLPRPPLCTGGFRHRSAFRCSLPGASSLFLRNRAPWPDMVVLAEE
nr:unnamed protein product [Digitaria exilis]